MNFKTYDILSSLVPGYLILLVFLLVLELPFEKEAIIPYTAIAFLLGYLVNTLGSWLEGFYFYTWGGKPSTQLLEGKDIWKVRFYQSKRAKELLINELGDTDASIDAMFFVAMRYGNGQSRVDDFNSMYAFSRALLTTAVIGFGLLIIPNYHNLQLYLVGLPIIFILWLRCKQRGFYYSREILNAYLKAKN